jgi:5-enolpyruvylshikimate-3-phosphate synthase
MSFAMLAIMQANIVLDDSENVIKSFPHFWEEAKKIGVRVIKRK